MRKRRREEHHEEEERYSLPMPKAKKRTQSATLKPNINDFHIIINEAIKSKLSSIIKATLKNNPESDIKDLKKTEEERKRVPRYTYDALDSQYGSYWTHNSLNRFKLNGLTMYTNYVKEQFDNLVDKVKDTLTKEIEKHEKADSGIKSSEDEQEQIKSIVVPPGQVLRKYLPIQARYKIMDNFNNAIQLYSNFASIFALNVHLNMLKFAMSRNITAESNIVQMDNTIPHEFQVSTTTVDLPAAPSSHENSDAKRQSDYKTLFTLSHLQVISTVIFGVSGIQKETQIIIRFGLN